MKIECHLIESKTDLPNDNQPVLFWNFVFKSWTYASVSDHDDNYLIDEDCKALWYGQMSCWIRIPTGQEFIEFWRSMLDGHGELKFKAGGTINTPITVQVSETSMRLEVQ